MDNPKEQQANNPLHGVKLVDILEAVVIHYGWEEMGCYINIRCFNYDPSIRRPLIIRSWSERFGESQNLMDLLSSHFVELQSSSYGYYLSARLI